MGNTLTERRERILKLVVQEFIDKAAPVASDMLVRMYELPVSSATVRNELAMLEEMGYLTQPYTSGGRIPTDSGYRFFVEHLMDSAPLTDEEQGRIRHQFTQVRSDIDEWIQLAASVMARTAQNASVVTPPRAYKVRFKHLELIAIHETVTLMVLVLHDGTVMQQMLTLDTLPPQPELRSLSAHMCERCADMRVDRIEELVAQDHQQHPPGFTSFEHQVLNLVIQMMHQAEDQFNEQIHRDGLLEMLSQPEFIPALVKENPNRAIERMRQTLELLTSNKAIGSLLLQALSRDGVHVIIGEEIGNEDMREYSIVLSRYGIDGTATGVVGVIGPTRMYYPRSISTVRYVSFVLSDLVGELYGGETRTLEGDER
jgi:heat-inducible transcriptional repressor